MTHTHAHIQHKITLFQHAIKYYQETTLKCLTFVLYDITLSYFTDTMKVVRVITLEASDAM